MVRKKIGTILGVSLLMLFLVGLGSACPPTTTTIPDIPAPEPASILATLGVVSPALGYVLLKRKK